jgi:hybrid cluster-associated redox disulfide protein
MEINENMTIAEVLKAKPDTAKVFITHGMHCVGCAIAAGETLAQAAVTHGVDIKKLIDDLNKAE